MNVAIFAGYDVLAFRKREHIDYIQASFQQATQVNVDYLLLIGGKTNSIYVTFSEAEANKKILIDYCLPKNNSKLKLEIIVLPEGDTAAERLKVAQEWLQANIKSVDLLFLCAEQSRLANFLMDALQVGLLDLSQTILSYGHNFPESKSNFSAERKKSLLHCLSHQSCFWRKIRWCLQKYHQRKMAKLNQ